MYRFGRKIAHLKEFWIEQVRDAIVAVGQCHKLGYAAGSINAKHVFYYYGNKQSEAKLFVPGLAKLGIEPRNPQYAQWPYYNPKKTTPINANEEIVAIGILLLEAIRGDYCRPTFKELCQCPPQYNNDPCQLIKQLLTSVKSNEATSKPIIQWLEDVSDIKKWKSKKRTIAELIALMEQECYDVVGEIKMHNWYRITYFNQGLIVTT